MPAIRRQGRRPVLARMLILFGCFDLGVPAPLRCTPRLCVSPPRASHFGKRPKVGKGLAPNIRFFAWAKNSLAPAKFQGHALTGHPWPDSAFAASMPLNPLNSASTRPPERGCSECADIAQEVVKSRSGWRWPLAGADLVREVLRAEVVITGGRRTAAPLVGAGHAREVLRSGSRDYRWTPNGCAPCRSGPCPRSRAWRAPTGRRRHC